ncbi:MAG: hypothetical protein ACI9LA_001672 [Bacteroidia bacterium]|jgi:hypothetical protein
MRYEQCVQNEVYKTYHSFKIVVCWVVKSFILSALGKTVPSYDTNHIYCKRS